MGISLQILIDRIKMVTYTEGETAALVTAVVADSYPAEEVQARHRLARGWRAAPEREEESDRDINQSRAKVL